VLDTRRSPGIVPDLRATLETRAVQISLHCGWAKKVSHNGGTIYVKGPKDHPLALALQAEMAAWGEKTCGHYGGVKIFDAKFPWLPDYSADEARLGIQLEPFCVNAIDAIVYAGRLRPLAAAIGKVIVAFMVGQNPALGQVRTVCWGNGPDGREVFGG